MFTKTCLVLSRRFVFVNLINVAFKSGSVFHSNARIFTWAKVTAAQTVKTGWGRKEKLAMHLLGSYCCGSHSNFKIGSARSPGLLVQCFTARSVLQLPRYIDTGFSSLRFWSEIRKFDPSTKGEMHLQERLFEFLIFQFRNSHAAFICFARQHFRPKRGCEDLCVTGK